MSARPTGGCSTDEALLIVVQPELHRLNAERAAVNITLVTLIATPPLGGARRWLRPTAERLLVGELIGKGEETVVRSRPIHGMHVVNPLRDDDQRLHRRPEDRGPETDRFALVRPQDGACPAVSRYLLVVVRLNAGGE